MTPSPPASSRVPRLAIAGVWAACVVTGLGLLGAYAAQPGTSLDTPEPWPAGSGLAPPEGTGTILVFIHPRCACSRATLTELARVVERTPARERVVGILAAPPAVDDDWFRTTIASTLKGIASEPVVLDTDARLADLFGARTSGHVIAYSPSGSLLFSGGITGARGHEGDNHGASALLRALAGDPGATPRLPVLGCGLLDHAPIEPCEGTPP